MHIDVVLYADVTGVYVSSGRVFLKKNCEAVEDFISQLLFIDSYTARLKDGELLMVTSNNCMQTDDATRRR